MKAKKDWREGWLWFENPEAYALQQDRYDKYWAKVRREGEKLLKKEKKEEGA